LACHFKLRVIALDIQTIDQLRMCNNFLTVSILLRLVNFLLILVFCGEKGVCGNLHGELVVLVVDSCLVKNVKLLNVRTICESIVWNANQHKRHN
jgi:hypothetical protein